MSSIPIEEAKEKLAELIHALGPGEQVVITENDRPVAHLSAPEAPSSKQPRRPGTLRGTVLHMAEDFDAPLDDFRDHME